MKIVIAADLHWPTINGVATFSRNLAHGLAAHGHDVTVIAPSQTGKRYEEVDRNHIVRRTTSLPFPFYQNFRISVSPQREVKKIIEEIQPDVIHVQGILGIGRAALMIGKRLNIPVVATNHAIPDNLLDNLKLLAPFAKPISYLLTEYGGRFHSSADYVTLPTMAAIKMFGDKTEEMGVPIVAISNGIDLSRFKPGKVPKDVYTRFGLPQDKPLISYIGRLDGEKHLHVLLRAAARVFKSIDAHLLVVGSGNDLENLEALAIELGIANKVTFTGRVSDEDLVLLHRVGTVFCVPSPAELQCIAALEAMASGQPLVAVDAGALYELCHDGENGYLCRTDDDEQIAKKLAIILKDPELRKKFSKASMAIAKTHDLEHTITRYEAVYNELLQKHQAVLA
ncbi:MAG TPA: glycosyltransferase [Verrucomicrobiae bacterium]|nr:glycosyltransferase [Verrucomicrobiae bacterium]